MNTNAIQVSVNDTEPIKTTSLNDYITKKLLLDRESSFVFIHEGQQVYADIYERRGGVDMLVTRVELYVGSRPTDKSWTKNESYNSFNTFIHPSVDLQ